MQYLDKLKSKIIADYGHLGHETIADWELIARAPHIAKLAWLFKFYKNLDEQELNQMRNQLGQNIPKPLAEFYACTNGLELFNTTFSISGYVHLLKREIGYWQPFPILSKHLSRPKNATENHFYFGGWDWDSSLAYMDIHSGRVYRCSEDDATPLNQWNSLEDLLFSEYARLVLLHDDKGKLLNEDLPTAP